MGSDNDLGPLPKVNRPKRNYASMYSAVRVEIGGPGDLASRFLSWSIDEEVFAFRGAGMAGGGKCIGYYSPRDADKIRDWLEQQDDCVEIEDERQG